MFQRNIKKFETGAEPVCKLETIQYCKNSRLFADTLIGMAPLTPQPKREGIHEQRSRNDYGAMSQFTPPKSSEKRHPEGLNIIHEDESLFSELMVPINVGDDEDQKDWVERILKQQTQEIRSCDLLADSLVSRSSPTLPDESPAATVDMKDPDSLTAATDRRDEMMRIFSVLRDGLRDYNYQLANAGPESVVMVRSDFLINYGQSVGCTLRTKMINDYLTMARNDEELLNYGLSHELADMTILEEIRNLVRESDRKRKLYIKRKNTMVENKRSVGSSAPETGGSPAESGERKKKSRFGKSKGLSVEKICIGYYGNNHLSAVANLDQILKVEEDEKYIMDLRNKNNFLRACIDDIYSPDLIFDHSLLYTKVPLNLNPDLSVDLESNRAVAYAENTLWVASHLAPNAVSSERFSRLLQMRVIFKVYDCDRLLLKRTEPVTGHLLSDNAHMKINLPLNAKYWSSLINEYSNGSINGSKFENIHITHTMYFDEEPDIVRTGKDVPIYSLIWEFLLNNEINYLPHSVSVLKKIDPRKSLTINSVRSNSFCEPCPVSNRGHKRTRSRSLTDLTALRPQMHPPPVFQQIVPKPQPLQDIAVSSAPAFQTRFAINDPKDMRRYHMHLQAAQIRAHQSQQIALQQQQQLYNSFYGAGSEVQFVPQEFQYPQSHNSSDDSISSNSSIDHTHASFSGSIQTTKSSVSGSTGVTPRLKEFQFEVTTIPPPREAEFGSGNQSSPTSSTISAHSNDGHESSKKKGGINTQSYLPGMGSINLNVGDCRASELDWKFYYYNP
ncbi:hypothetical protein KL905_002980 [Ogataea polymorpha]|uniref:uncharacterized protein n=1 Tax=Ogataea polymorpha TaxID=460523 RepID=UPI0007F53D3D|nr:uncharacterized protein OGAPODRAFT_15442 [Ogataea polymorpha]KAG7904847.1 hypothetical protein KL907_003063 [Ogataea polymorpha]KAG7908032.1 hypothetical protein KL906_003449 [Ogataea polymorpha]KAG7916615.1 hypothetical protein KL927_003254 [Ogataea polymorpha]KAG7921522.1 hypothetical protein KL905_002980 [Ogataea polymorpha]KAG7933916.1 hypothetical protein KL934_002838 [Ogataea polymorpha]